MPTNINPIMSNKTKINDFTLGCDPEFSLYYKNSRIIYAYDALYDEKTNYSGGEIGYDGNETQFEIRPKPSKCPIEVTQNIQNIICASFKNIKRLQNKRVVIKSNSSYGCGGHIHFGIKRDDISDILKFLDAYVGVISMLLEGKESSTKRRKNSGYGHSFDYRHQDHGFEYRVPSCWLSHPCITAAILSLAKVVVFESLNNKKASISHDKHAVVCDIINSSKISFAQKQFPSIWSNVTKMQLYPKYQNHLKIIPLLVSQNKTWFTKSSFLNNWGVKIYTYTNKPSKTTNNSNQ